MPTYFIDPVNGNDANDGLSFANRKRNISSVAGSLVAGDNVRIIANPAPTNIGLCTWNSLSTITLPAGETATLYNDGSWAGSPATVTNTLNTTTRKEGVNANQSAVLNTYTGTTKIASFSGFGPANLSTYSKINLWFSCSQLTYANLSAFSILLCSDNNGNTPVYTFRFPASIPPQTTGLIPIVIDNGSTLSLATNINSITLSADRAIGAATANVIVDNVFASKNIRLDGLISKNSTTQVDITKPEFWWSPRSVTNNILTVEQGAGQLSYASSPSRGYIGTTETVSAYVVESLPIPASSSTNNTALYTITNRTGTEASPIIINGGWDRTNMSQQISGVSWLRSSNGNQYIINQTGTSRNITYNSLGFTRCEEGIRITGTGTSVNAISGINLTNVHIVGASDNGLVLTTATLNSFVLSGCSIGQSGYYTAANNFADSLIASNTFNLSVIDTIVYNSDGSEGVSITNCPNGYFRNFGVLNSTRDGINLQSGSCLFENVSSVSNGGIGMVIGGTINVSQSPNNNTFINGVFANNGSSTTVNGAGILFSSGVQKTSFYNTLISANSGNAVGGGIVFSNNGNGTIFYGLTTLNNRSSTNAVAMRFINDVNPIISQSDFYVYNWVSNETLTRIQGWIGGFSQRLYSTNEQLNTNSHYVYADNGTVEGTSTSARSPGICWQMNPGNINNSTGTFFRGSQYPLVHNIKSVLCTANIPMTASLWVRRTNSDVSGNFVLKGYQIGGINNNISTSTTSTSLTDWERLSIAFTPTQTGFVEFEMQAFASNYYSTTAPTGILIWDDFNVTPSTTVAATSGDYAFAAQGVVVSTPINSIVASSEKSFLFC